MTMAPTGTRPKRILIIEDEDTIRQTLRYNLIKEGFRVSEARSGSEALREARKLRPDLVILDLMLPELSGLEVCRILRQESTVPILILTAKTSELDKVVGLRVGADDYVTKPFSLNELLARVTALLRRVEMGATEVREGPEIEQLGGFRIDRAARTVHMNDEELRLSPKEFELLSFLLTNAGRVQPREHIIRQVWGTNYFGDRKTVDVHVRWLREKFERFENVPLRITTVFGVGYRLDRNDGARPTSAGTVAPLLRDSP
jgi:DNA-binding response OmpR family regulator